MEDENQQFKSKTLLIFKIVFVITFLFILILGIYMIVNNYYTTGYVKHARNEVHFSGVSLLILDLMLLIFYVYNTNKGSLNK